MGDLWSSSCCGRVTPSFSRGSSLEATSTSYGKPVSKTENGGFNTFAGVFDPANGRIGPAVLEVPLAISGEASNTVCHFIQDTIPKIFRHNLVSSKSVSDAIYAKNKPHFRMKRRYIAGNLLSFFFSESGNTVNKSNDTLGEKKNGSRYLSPNDRKYSEKSEPNSARPRG